MGQDISAAAELLHEECADLFARLYADGSGFCKNSVYSAYLLLRTAENIGMLSLSSRAVSGHAFCVADTAEKFLADVGFSCPDIRYSFSASDRAVFCGCSERHFLFCFYSLIVHLLSYGNAPIRISLRHCGTFFCVSAENNTLSHISARFCDLSGGLCAVRHFVRIYGGNFLEYRSAHTAGAAFFLPCCENERTLHTQAASDFRFDRFSPLYVGLSPFCQLPRRFFPDFSS